MASRISPYVDNTGLVFAYDLANVNRSYLGEPTVNIAAGLGLTDLGTGLTYIGVEDGWKKYSMSGTWSGGGYPYSMALDTVGFTGGLPYSVKATLKTNVENKFNYFSTSGISYVNQPKDYEGDLSSTLNSDGSRTVTRTNFAYTSTTGQLGYLFTNPINGITFNPATDFVYLKAFQAEQKTHPTQFTAGTRSVTQGLKDLTGRSTIDLTNVSFDANAQMTFDGTNDQIVLDDYASSIPYGGTITVETIVKFYSFTPNDVIVAYGGNNTNFGWLHQYEFTAGLMFGIQNNPSYGAAQIGTEASQQYLNKFIHMVGTYDGTTVRLYINGNSVASQSYAAGIPQSTTFRIGNESGRSYYSNMDLPLARIYNRALPASEIQQNFNAIKGRYGL